MLDLMTHVFLLLDPFLNFFISQNSKSCPKSSEFQKGKARNPRKRKRDSHSDKQSAFSATSSSLCSLTTARESANDPTVTDDPLLISERPYSERR